MRWQVHSEEPLYADPWLDVWVADVELPAPYRELERSSPMVKDTYAYAIEPPPGPIG